ncbi:hypothetical protein [Amycolatopsis thermoflava]|uniref:hypothetical protein n=1 Tax=Amycolatopsis thermoflava TaxID=84480 RepID=UPI000484B169|nr:hypothetical protein [Amycolatopsis thermoflava]
MTDTNPPELYWSNTLGLLKRKDDLWWVATGGWESLRHHLGTGADSNPEPAHADRLVPQTELDKANRRYEVAFEGREDAWNQLDAILAAFGETTETVDMSSVARFVEQQVTRVVVEMARLRDQTPTPRWDEDPLVIERGWLEGRCGKCGEELAGGDSQRRALWELLKTAVREYRLWRERARVVNTERAKANGERDAARAELAGLREHAIQLPSAAELKIRELLRSLPGGLDGHDTNRAVKIMELLESWRTATPAFKCDAENLNLAPEGSSHLPPGASGPGWSCAICSGRSNRDQVPDWYASWHDDHAPSGPRVLGVDQPNPPATGVTGTEKKPPTLAETRTGTDWCPWCKREVGTDRYTQESSTLERCGVCSAVLKPLPGRPVSETSPATNVGASDPTSNETGLIVGASETSELHKEEHDG